MRYRFEPLAHCLTLMLVTGLACACSTKNGPGNGSSGTSASSGSSSSNGSTTVCQRSIDQPSLCDCSTFHGNTATNNGYVCVSTCNSQSASGAQCCLMPDNGSTSISFCACSTVTCAASDTPVTDCRTASANGAIQAGLGEPTFATCN